MKKLIPNPKYRDARYELQVFNKILHPHRFSRQPPKYIFRSPEKARAWISKHSIPMFVEAPR